MCWGCGAVDEVSRVKFKESMVVEGGRGGEGVARSRGEREDRTSVRE